ncbi:MAG: alpha/beta hydrolase, partial [Streptosporangiaceae bacterium]|nr:alpha/beta hydrolase [Streptosporangiaceae bacterium]
GLALFGAFASREKTLHANPGRHAGVPAFELDSSERFFTRHLV